MIDINKKFLSDDDFNELINEFNNGSKEAYKTIIQKSLPFIDEVLKDHINNDTYDYALLYKIGEFALNEAIKAYKSNTGFKSYVKMCILYKIKNHLEKNPNPSIPKEHKTLFENINKELKLGITEKDYLDIRAIIELQSPRVKMIIKLRYGYNAKCMSEEDIARKYNYNLEAVRNAINNFNNILTKRYLGKEYKQEDVEAKKEPKEKISLKSSIFEYFEGYTKEEVRYAIGILPNSQRNIIYSKYGTNLSENNNIDALSNNAIYNEIIGIIESILINYKKNKIKKNFYEYFLDYSKDDVKYAVMHLPKKESSLVYRRFGYDLNSFNLLSSKEIEQINNTIIPHIRSLLKEKIDNQIKSLFDYFKDYSEELIIFAISKLGEKQKEIIFNRFGNNLDNTNTIDKTDLKLLEEAIIPRLSQILNEKHTLFDINDITKDRLKEALKELTKEEQLLFYKKFIKKESLIRSELINLYIKVLPKLNKILKLNNTNTINRVSKAKTIYDYFEGFTKEEVNNAISKLEEKYQIILFKRYGQNFNEFHQLSQKERNSIYSVIIPRIRKILKGEKVKSPSRSLTTLEYFKGHSLKQIKEAVSKLDNEEKEIVYKRFGKNLDEYHSLPKEYHGRLKRIRSKINSILNDKEKHNKTLLERIPDYNAEQIKDAISKLPLNQQQVIYKRFGISLNEYHSIPKNEFSLLNFTIKKINVILNGKTIENRKKSLIDKLNTYSYEEISQVVSTLSKEEQDLIYKKYGLNLDEYHTLNANENSRINRIIKKIKKELVKDDSKENTKNRKIKYKTIFAYFEGFTKEEIINAINNLEPKYQELVYKKYGPNLDEYHSLTKEDSAKFYGSIMPKIRGLLNNKNKKSVYKTKTITHYFEGSTLDEIKEAISKLKPSYQAIVHKKYGIYLDEINPLEEKEKLIFYHNISPKIKSFLKGNSTSKRIGRKRKNIIEYLDGYTKEEVALAINKLSSKDQNLIYKIYGLNLNETNGLTNSEREKIKNSIIPNIKKILNGEEISIDKRFKPLLTYFDGFTKEEVINAINYLEPKYQELVYKKYGLNLDEQNTLPRKEQAFVRQIIIPKLKKILNGELIKPISFYNLIGLSKEDTLRRIECLSKEEREDLFKYYGYDLDKIKYISSDSLLKEKVDIIIPKLKDMDVNKERVFNIDALSPVITNILKEVTNVSKLEIIIFILRIGLEINGPYDIDMMSDYFKLSPEEINSITLKVLKQLSVNLDIVYAKIAKGLSKLDETKPLMIKPIEGDNNN